MFKAAHAAIAIAAVAALPVMIMPPEPHASVEQDAAASSAQTASLQKERKEPVSGRKLTLPSDARGHFVTDFRLNGYRVTSLVDTGATSVAINMSMARRMGLKMANSDFKYLVQTANGAVRVAQVKLDSVEVGRIRVYDVTAAVLPDDALGGALIGMSFLNKLKSFKVEGRQLTLEQ